MITKKEQQSIIEVLGKHYTKAIISYLQSIGLFNRKGEPYSAESIRQIVNMEVEKPPVEIAILKLVAKTRLAIKRNAVARKNLIAKK